MTQYTGTWELGAGMGHVHSLSSYAKKLSSQGHQVNYILKDLRESSFFIKDVEVRQAPIAKVEGVKLPMPIINYTEILFLKGYFNADFLFQLVNAWRQLFIALKTEKVIADHSPTAVLAAHTLDIPCTSLGTGFASPPREKPIPCFFPDEKHDPKRIRETEKGVLSGMNAVLEQCNKPVFSAVCDLFNTLEEDLLRTREEVDCYPQRNTGRYIGATTIDLQHSETFDFAKGNNEKKVFVYLNTGFKELNQFLEVFNKVKADFYIYIFGLADEVKAKFGHSNLYFSESPVNIEHTLSHVNSVITHGNHGLIMDCMKYEKPMFFLPMTMEQLMNSRRMEAGQYGIIIKELDDLQKL